MTELQLPVLAFRDAIIEAVQHHPVTVIQADTGAGKTTQVPRMLIAAGLGSRGIIGITQPRRIAAISVAEYVAALDGSPLGELIGYQIKGDRRTSDATRVKFMTEGILLRELHSDPTLARYEVIVVDEAHERGINQDLLLALLHRIRAARPDLKIVIMSATIDAARFAAHFDGAPVVTVPGRLFPVEVRYDRETPIGTRALIKRIAEKVDEIVRGRTPGDILVFLPDERTIRDAAAAIEDLGLHDVRVLPLFRNQSPDEQREVFRRTRERRIILATNIAETSLTIDGVVHVVDSGFIKQVQYVNATMSALVVTDHSKAGCDQRKGRAGRTQPGICHRLFGQDDFAARPDFTEPDILRTALDAVLLHLRVLGYSMDDVKALKFMDAPGDARWDEAAEQLQVLGALGASGAVTPDGERMDRLPVAPMLGRMILEAERYECLNEIVTIVAAFSARPVFLKAKQPDEQPTYDAAHAPFRNTTSDALTMLTVWAAWCDAGENGSRTAWARERFLSSRALRDIERDREHLIGALSSMGMAITSHMDTERVRKAVAAGLIVNVCVVDRRFAYAWRDRQDVFIHPSSALFRQRQPSVMVCTEVVETSKAFARNCTAIPKEWIAELVPTALLERTWTVQMPFLPEEPPGLTECVRWHGVELERRAVTEIPDAAIPAIALAILDEIVRVYGPLHPQSSVNTATWRILKDALGIHDCWGVTREACDAYPVLKAMLAFFVKKLQGARTFAEVRSRDLMLQIEDFLTPEQAARYAAEAAAARENAEAEQRRHEAYAAERATGEAARRVREDALRASLRADAQDALERVAGLNGDEATAIRNDLNFILRSLDNPTLYHPLDAARKDLARFRVRLGALEGQHRHEIELTALGWRLVREACPACPLCGGAWQEERRALVCRNAHDRNRVLSRERALASMIGRYRTDRDEEIAHLTIVSNRVELVFPISQTQVWTGRRFKTVRYEPHAAILPPELVAERDAIARDLDELRAAMAELAAVEERVRIESAARGVPVRPFTFHVVEGRAEAENGTLRYRAAYQDLYPADGERWFCSVGEALDAFAFGKRVVEVHPLFRAGSVSSAADLDELRALLRATYPNLPEDAFLSQ